MLLGLLVLHMYTLCVSINKIIDSVHGKSHNEICMRALVNINQLISCLALQVKINMPRLDLTLISNCSVEN